MKFTKEKNNNQEQIRKIRKVTPHNKVKQTSQGRLSHRTKTSRTAKQTEPINQVNQPS